MKYKDCPAYDKNTETIKKEIGSARGEILYKDNKFEDAQKIYKCERTW